MSIDLRPWQAQATNKAEHWLVDEGSNRIFLIDAAPGSGKTVCAISVAEKLFKRGVIDQVVVIAPRAEVVNQWAKDFQRLAGRTMLKVVGQNANDVHLGHDVCATWAAVDALKDEFRQLCASRRTLVICDEHHHASVEAVWGTSADQAFADAKYVLVLTGTPVRSDGSESIWLPYGEHGGIAHPAAGTFTLTYGEAVGLGYCRPATFHRHEGRFTVDLDAGQSLEVSGQMPAELPQELAPVKALQAALEYYKLVCTPQYDPLTGEPSMQGYHASMLEAAILKLEEVRNRMANAGGLVIAPSIEMAEFFAALLEKLEGEKPIVVHTKSPGAEQRIAAFRHGSKKWLVSVAMVSEGVDIPRLRVLVYLPYAKTELAFRQAVGRVVRNSVEEGDDSYAHVIMPRLATLEEHAMRIEDELAPHWKKNGPPRAKKCPVCQRENSLGAADCEGCGHEFPRADPRTRPCPECSAPVRLGARTCDACGHNMLSNFTIRLKEAMREGVIVRGLDIGEQDARESEQLADEVRKQVLQSGDMNLIQLIRVLPPASLGRIKRILDGSGQGAGVGGTDGGASGGGGTLH
jgi:superfamily II DNA or RNA helicase